SSGGDVVVDVRWPAGGRRPGRSVGRIGPGGDGRGGDGWAGRKSERTPISSRCDPFAADLVSAKPIDARTTTESWADGEIGETPLKTLKGCTRSLGGRSVGCSASTEAPAPALHSVLTEHPTSPPATASRTPFKKYPADL